MNKGVQPPNFSWIVQDLLAGSSFPNKLSNFDFFRQQGIQNIVTLTEYKIPQNVIHPDITVTHMPVVEFAPPSLQQLIRFVHLVDEAKDKNERVVCHCHWGRGRTGTMLAAYLVKHGGYSARQAIDYVRGQRPYSVETQRQERSVIEYAEYLRGGETATGKCTRYSMRKNAPDLLEEDDEFIFY